MANTHKGKSVLVTVSVLAWVLILLGLAQDVLADEDTTSVDYPVELTVRDDNRRRVITALTHLGIAKDHAVDITLLTEHDCDEDGAVRIEITSAKVRVSGEATICVQNGDVWAAISAALSSALNNLEGNAPHGDRFM